MKRDSVLAKLSASVLLAFLVEALARDLAGLAEASAAEVEASGGTQPVADFGATLPDEAGFLAELAESLAERAAPAAELAAFLEDEAGSLARGDLALVVG